MKGGEGGGRTKGGKRLGQEEEEWERKKGIEGKGGGELTGFFPRIDRRFPTATLKAMFEGLGLGVQGRNFRGQLRV